MALLAVVATLALAGSPAVTDGTDDRGRLIDSSHDAVRAEPQWSPHGSPSSARVTIAASRWTA
jgi:hypothetical protein